MKKEQLICSKQRTSLRSINSELHLCLSSITTGSANSKQKYSEYCNMKTVLYE